MEDCECSVLHTDICLRDSNRAVASSLDPENLDKLIEISNFAEEISSKTSKRTKCLSKKTQKIVCCRHVMVSGIINSFVNPFLAHL